MKFQFAIKLMMTLALKLYLYFDNNIQELHQQLSSICFCFNVRAKPEIGKIIRNKFILTHKCFSFIAVRTMCVCMAAFCK